MNRASSRRVCCIFAIAARGVAKMKNIKSVVSILMTLRDVIQAIVD
jgi:hypothetical protein